MLWLYFTLRVTIYLLSVWKAFYLPKAEVGNLLFLSWRWTMQSDVPCEISFWNSVIKATTEEGSLVREAETKTSEPDILAMVAYAIFLGNGEICFTDHPSDIPWRLSLYPQPPAWFWGPSRNFLDYQQLISKFLSLLHLARVGWLFPAKDSCWKSKQIFLPVTAPAENHRGRSLLFLQMLLYPHCPLLNTLDTHQVKGSGAT